MREPDAAWIAIREHLVERAPQVLLWSVIPPVDDAVAPDDGGGRPSGIIAVLRRRTEPPQRVDQFHCLPDAVEMPRQPPDQRAAGALQRLVVAVLADPEFG
jgi:hypothetical protein